MVFQHKLNQGKLALTRHFNMLSQGLVVINEESYINKFSLSDRFYLSQKREFMNLRASIEERYKEAIKSKKLEKANTLRLIKSAIKDKDIENRTSESSKKISDHQILAILQTLIKQRKDSIESFKIASRDDLIAKEELEIDLISQFLPKQLNERETEEIIKAIIKKQSFSSLKDMGTLMNNLKSEYAGSIDMAVAGKIAKLLLNN